MDALENFLDSLLSQVPDIIYAIILLVVAFVVAKIFDMIPNVLGAILIIAIGVFIAKLVAQLLQSLLAGVGADTLIEKITGTPAKKIVLSKVIASVVQYVLAVVFLVQGINVLVAFLCLSELGVASAIVETTFVLIIAAVCVAFAIAFGVGGRTFAANTLEKIEKKIDSKEADKE